MCDGCKLDEIIIFTCSCGFKACKNKITNCWDYHLRKCNLRFWQKKRKEIE